MFSSEYVHSQQNIPWCCRAISKPLANVEKWNHDVSQEKEEIATISEILPAVVRIKILRKFWEVDYTLSYWKKTKTFVLNTALLTFGEILFPSKKEQ